MKKWFNDVGASVKSFWSTFKLLRGTDRTISEDPTCEVKPKSKSDLHSIIGNRTWGIAHGQIGSLLSDGCTTIFAKQFPYVEVAMFTAQIYCAVKNRDIDSIGCMHVPVVEFDANHSGDSETSHYSGRLVFIQKEIFDEFEEWLAEYKERWFGPDYDFRTVLPTITNRTEFSGRFVEHGCEFTARRSYPEHEGKFLRLPDDQLFDDWKWVINNCSGQVRITYDHWAFTEASDALMYQLQMR